MKTYFSRITADHWTAKNNLQKAAHKLAHEMDRRLIQEHELTYFKNEFKECAKRLNQQFSRCKPLRFSIEASHSKGGDYVVYCDGVFHMGIFLAKDPLTFGNEVNIINGDGG